MHPLPSLLLLTTTLLLGLPATRADETRDAIAAIHAREVARAADPQGTQHANLILGTVLLPVGLIFLLYVVAQRRA